MKVFILMITIYLQIPGLIVEPVLFTIICYWLAGLRATAYAFVMTAIITIFVMNIATACGEKQTADRLIIFDM